MPYLSPTDLVYNEINARISKLQPSEVDAFREWLTGLLAKELGMKHLYILAFEHAQAGVRNNQLAAMTSIAAGLLQKVFAALTARHESWDLFQLYELKKISYDPGLASFLLFPYSYEDGKLCLLLAEQSYPGNSGAKDEFYKAASVFKKLRAVAEKNQPA